MPRVSRLNTKTYKVHVLDDKGVHITDEKVKAIYSFPAPINNKTFLSFLGLSVYYRSFIKNYSTITRPLTQLTRKEVSFKWPEHMKAFKQLKDILMTSLVLA